MKFLKTVFFAMAISWLGQVNAFTWTSQTKVSSFLIYTTGWAYFKTETAHINPDNCPDNSYLALDTTLPNFKYLYATIILAYSQQLTVSLNYDGCNPSYPKIISIALPHVW